MSPSMETGCSEVSTTVTLLDGANGGGKDDSSTSAANSPSIEHPKEQARKLDESLEKDNTGKQYMVNTNVQRLFKSLIIVDKIFNYNVTIRRVTRNR